MEGCLETIGAFLILVFVLPLLLLSVMCSGPLPVPAAPETGSPGMQAARAPAEQGDTGLAGWSEVGDETADSGG